jgi:hypothetical protein
MPTMVHQGTSIVHVGGTITYGQGPNGTTTQADQFEISAPTLFLPVAGAGLSLLPVQHCQTLPIVVRLPALSLAALLLQTEPEQEGGDDGAGRCHAWGQPGGQQQRREQVARSTDGTGKGQAL